MPFSVNVNKCERAIHPLHGMGLKKMCSAKAGPFHWELIHIYCGLLQNKFNIIHTTNRKVGVSKIFVVFLKEVSYQSCIYLIKNM